MVKFKIAGMRKGKKFLSRKTFTSEKSANRYALTKLVFNPSGNTKRKHQLSNFRFVKVK